jgi:hypothetical protein
VCCCYSASLMLTNEDIHWISEQPICYAPSLQSYALDKRKLRSAVPVIISLPEAVLLRRVARVNALRHNETCLGRDAQC